MHVPPAARRWGLRVGLAIVVAVAIGYVPTTMLRRDPRAVKLEAQLADLASEAKALTAKNALMSHEINGLRTDVGAIEDRARADLGMVYPDEIIMRVEPHR